MIRKIHDLVPLGRVASAAKIAGPLLLLASNLASHINGEILSGGCVLCG